MSVYHKWKCIFVQIPKNASSSIHIILKNLTDNNIHNHQTYFEIIQKNDIDLLKNYYSFAVVRNPYDRLVSAYEYDKFYNNSDFDYDSHNKKNVFDNFRKFVKTFYKKIYERDENINSEYVDIFHRQSSFITDKNIILVDDIIRFENINEDWKKVVKKINNINNNYKISDKLALENERPIKASYNWKNYYDDEMREMAYEIYKKDFELFGYEK